jgi:ketosteroid isomerase-like protein
VAEHPNLRIAKKVWDAASCGSAALLREVLSPGVVFRAYGAGELTGIYAGVNATLDFLASSADLSDSLVSQLVDIYVSEEGAVLRYKVTARRPGVDLDGETLMMLRIIDGFVVECVAVPIDQIRSDEFWSSKPNPPTE